MHSQERRWEVRENVPYKFEGKKVSVSVSMPTDLYVKLFDRALDQRRGFSDVVCDLIRLGFLYDAILDKQKEQMEHLAKMKEEEKAREEAKKVIGGE